MDAKREIDDWFAATRPAAPSAELTRALLDMAEAQRPRSALRAYDLPALAASLLVGLWLGYAPLQGLLTSTAAAEDYAGLDLIDVLQLEETP